MKFISTLTLAALMSTGAAFAATTPTATPASSATPAAAAKPAKHEGSMHCDKQAKEKKLTGDEKDKFVKECKESAHAKAN
jgi:Spy/CpxP family protein refolding chaperone